MAEPNTVQAKKTGNAESRVAALDERLVLKDEGFRAALETFAEHEQRDLAEVERYARECLEELSVRPADRYLRWVASLARFMYTRSFEPEFDVNTEALEKLKQQAREHPLVFLWSHKSHLDSFVFMRALYDADFRPQPLSFAGINMAFVGFGALAKHSGAIFLRRSFKDDPVYKIVLKHFIDYLVRERVPLSWSIEGTRSRTGKLMPPKLGLIQWVVDSYKRASCNDALLVPVAISFDQIPEIDDYIAMQRGLPKRKETLKWFIDYIAGMKARYGKIYVRFAEPVSLSESVHVSDALLGVDRDRAQVQRLAFEVYNRIEHLKPVNTTDLVTLVLLAANGRGLDEEQIRRQAQDIVELIDRWGLPKAADLRVDSAAALEAKLDTLTGTGLLERYAKGQAPVYVIAPGRQLAAAYYRNTIVQYFLNSAIAELALAATGDGASDVSVIEVSMALRDLLKFEFFFRPKAEFRSEVINYLDARYPGWRVSDNHTHGYSRGHGGPFPSAPAPLFGQGILRSFLEAYSIFARLIMERDDGEVATEDEAGLLRDCLGRGEEMLLRKEISTEAALSQPLFETALGLARHRRLLEGVNLASKRQAFAADVDLALAAVNVLQSAYDNHINERPAAGPAAQQPMATSA